MTLLFSEVAEPDWEVNSKGHGCLEHRQVWVSGELEGYGDLPGLSSVAMVKKRGQSGRQGAGGQRPVCGIQPTGVAALGSPEPGAGPLEHRKQLVPRQGGQFPGRPLGPAPSSPGYGHEPAPQRAGHSTSRRLRPLVGKGASHWSRPTAGRTANHPLLYDYLTLERP